MARDLYVVILGLPPGPRPPHYYDLLGLRLFENDPSVIHAGGLCQTRQLKAWELHKDPAVVRGIQTLHVEVSQALYTLEFPARKSAYDQELAKTLGMDLPLPPAHAVLTGPPAMPLPAVSGKVLSLDPATLARDLGSKPPISLPAAPPQETPPPLPAAAPEPPVPAPAGRADPAGQFMNCPRCGDTMSALAAICMKCGCDVRTGKTSEAWRNRRLLAVAGYFDTVLFWVARLLWPGLALLILIGIAWWRWPVTCELPDEARSKWRAALAASSLCQTYFAHRERLGDKRPYLAIRTGRSGNYHLIHVSAREQPGGEEIFSASHAARQMTEADVQADVDRLAARLCQRRLAGDSSFAGVLSAKLLAGRDECRQFCALVKEAKTATAQTVALLLTLTQKHPDAECRLASLDCLVVLLAATDRQRLEGILKGAACDLDQNVARRAADELAAPAVAAEAARQYQAAAAKAEAERREALRQRQAAEAKAAAERLEAIQAAQAKSFAERQAAERQRQAAEAKAAAKAEAERQELRQAAEAKALAERQEAKRQEAARQLAAAEAKCQEARRQLEAARQAAQTTAAQAVEARAAAQNAQAQYRRATSAEERASAEVKRAAGPNVGRTRRERVLDDYKKAAAAKFQAELELSKTTSARIGAESEATNAAAALKVAEARASEAELALRQFATNLPKASAAR